VTKYWPTDFAVAKRMAADLKEYREGADKVRADYPGPAGIADDVVDRLRNALHGHGFDENGDPIG
jgi:hypothetical protein